jgi:ribokinase
VDLRVPFGPMDVAVVGHLEWVRFVRVDHVPRAGEIVHPEETWELPGGGGPVAAVQLAKLAGSCAFFTAVGDDDLGRRSVAELEALGVRVHAAVRPAPTRQAITFVDAEGERTITTLGERLESRADDPLPWSELDGTDAVYFTAGDLGALRAARRGRVLVATTRAMDRLAGSRVALDAVVGSATDPSERFDAGALVPTPWLVVRTEGRDGGSWEAADGRVGRYAEVPPPGPISDLYGCGDSFAAGLTFGLGEDRGVAEALDLAARCGAWCATGWGPYEGQLASAER